jgi:CBS domain-containing protein
MTRSTPGRETGLERFLGVVSEGTERVESRAKFPSRTVGDVMTRDVVTAHEGAAFKEVARALERNHVNGVPVIDSDRRVVGIITASDLLARVTGGTRPIPRGHRLAAGSESRRKRHATTAKDLMTAPAITATTRTTIAEAARLTARSRVRSLPVVDAQGVLVGIVTRGDLIKLFLREDADIRRDVLRDVAQNPIVAARGRVEVEVDEGVVTLTGSVDTALTARRIAYDAGQVIGVVDVRDEIQFEINDAFLPFGG